jgi:flavin-dependent dehydrogenase
MRADLDEFLLEQAQAELRQGDALVSVEERSDRVIVTTRLGRRFEGRYLIGADGPNSAVAHALGLRRNKIILGAIEVEAPVPSETFQRFKEAPVFIFGEIDMGYLWIFPKAEHLSVGIGALHPQPGELQGTLQRVMEQYQVPIQGLPMHGHPVPIYTRREKISTARALLVGDAAGLVDPLNGEGIRYAVQSGRLAAEAILADQIGQYEKRIHQQIGRSHRVNWLVAQIAYRHQGTFFELFMHNPFARRAFSDSFSEKSGQRALMLRLLGSLPPYLVMKGVKKITRLPKP